jgi:hypothetical protein
MPFCVLLGNDVSIILSILTRVSLEFMYENRLSLPLQY